MTFAEVLSKHWGELAGLFTAGIIFGLAWGLWQGTDE